MILAIDPGRNKFGWAFVGEDEKLIVSGITPTEDLDAFIEILKEGLAEKIDGKWIMESKEPVVELKPQRIVLGGGTGSQMFEKSLRSTLLPIHTINEKNSTLEARDIYWKLHKPSVWQRLFPKGVMVPNRDLDDLAAYCLAVRFLALR